MANFIRKLMSVFSRAAAVHSTPPSVALVLKRLLSRSAYARLRAETVDRRQILEVAARIVGLSEDELLERVAKKTGLPIAQQVKPLALSRLSAEFTVADLRRCGAIAVLDGDVLVGFVCVDPALLRLLPGISMPLRLQIAPWASIARALDQSEQILIEEEQGRERSRKQKLEQAAQKVLSLMVGVVAAHSSKRMLLQFSGNLALYLFTTGEGKPGRGDIDKRMSAPLIELLDRLVANRGYRLKLNAEESEVALTVLAADPGRQYSLEWQELAEEQSSTEDLSKVLNLEKEASLPQAREGAVVQQIAPGVSQFTFGEKAVLTPEDPVRRELKLVTNKVSSEIPEQVPAPIIESRGAEIKASTEPASRQSRDELVLIVDDNLSFARVLERFFARQSLRCLYIDSAEKALEMLQGDLINPCLIVCDVHMPGLSGFDFIKKVRSAPKFDAMPVIMLTSDNDVETELKLIAEGAEVFLNKTEDPRVLCAHSMRLINKRRAA